MSDLTLPLLTKRLVLRPFEPTDLDGLEAYLSHPEVLKYLDWKKRDRADCAQALKAMCNQTVLYRPGDKLTLAVEHREDGKLLGEVQLVWQDATAGQAELGFVLHPEYQGEGYGTEAVRMMLDVGFGHFKFHRIYGRCDARNRASARLMERLGMRLEAHFREHALFKGEWDEELHYALLNREWQLPEAKRPVVLHNVA